MERRSYKTPFEVNSAVYVHSNPLRMIIYVHDIAGAFNNRIEVEPGFIL